MTAKSTDAVRNPSVRQPTPENRRGGQVIRPMEMTSAPGEFFNVNSYQVVQQDNLEQEHLGQLASEIVNPDSVVPHQNFAECTGSQGLTTMTLPLGVSVNPGIKEKIWKGEFTELGSLLSDNAKIPATGLGTFSLTPGGVITCTPPKHTQITSIEKWTDAFIIYTAIFCAKHPDRGPELLKYMSIIRDTAAKFPGGGWIEYDQQFRRRQAYMPQRSWALIDGELWYTVLIPAAVTGNIPPQTRGQNEQPFRTRAAFQWPQTVQSNRQSGGDFSLRAPMQRFGPPRTEQKGTCWAYNRNACYANPCQWAHVCSKCRAPTHTAGNCRRSEFNAPTNSRM